MTDKEMKKLSRLELIEIMLEQSKEIDRLKARIEELESSDQRRVLQCQEAGNIAEASLRLNKVFEAAQAAADQYVKSVMAMHEANPSGSGASEGEGVHEA